MNVKLIGSFALLAFFAVNPAQSQQIIPIKDDVHEHMFTETDVAYMEDAKNQLTINDVSGPLRDKFILNRLFSPHNANTNSPYWIRLRIQDNPESKRKWILEFFDQTTDYIEAYIPKGNGYEKKLMGDQFEFHNRTFQHKNFEIFLENNTNTSHDYYFKVKSSNHLNIIIVLRSIDHFIYYSLNEYLLFGFFYGMIVVVTIYNLLMFFAVRERQYLAYIAYIMSVGFYISCSDGIAFQYLWPSHPQWNESAYGIALYSVILGALMFTKMFLHTKSRHPRLNRTINVIIALRTVIFITALFLYHPLFEYRWIEFMPLSVAFYAGVYSFVKGYKAARFFALAYGLLFAGFMVKIMINMDPPLISGSILTHYSITISFWFEMWLLSFALGDKVRIIKGGKDRALRRIIVQHEENQKLKDKVNKELEAEVLNRTKEINHQKLIIENQYHALQKANEKLQEQADEITKMNSLLDLDNYKLKNSIKEEMLARAGSKSMEYTEFKKIFPDELTCMRYLEQQKWQNGFTCKKCENDKFLPGKGKFDRRCTRCGYSESPTAFTVFHGIKFPIEKAFYILHLVITERDDLTVDDISRILDLRRNTCWGFKDKIIKVIKTHKLEKGQFVHWENVIFTAITKTDLTPSQNS